MSDLLIPLAVNACRTAPFLNQFPVCEETSRLRLQSPPFLTLYEIYFNQISVVCSYISELNIIYWLYAEASYKIWLKCLPAPSTVRTIAEPQDPPRYWGAYWKLYVICHIPNSNSVSILFSAHSYIPELVTDGLSWQRPPFYPHKLSLNGTPRSRERCGWADFLHVTRSISRYILMIS